MPYGDANGVVMEMAGEVLPVVNHTPVLAGVCASDPFRLMDKFLDDIKAEGFLTTPYVFSEEDATAMAKAGADIIVCHLGLTTGGSIGAETGVTLEQCPALVDFWVNPYSLSWAVMSVCT